jgi:hypothetical protein
LRHKYGNLLAVRAVKNRNVEIAQMLLERKAKLTATDKSGELRISL